MKKRILSIALIASLVLSAAGCGETGSSDKINLDNIEEKIENMSNDEIEQAVLDGAEKLEEEYGNGSEITEAATTTAAPEPEEIVYEPTQEILDADFSSMKIQINNDVFQMGGYVTVAELYEQYKDKYDFTYFAGVEEVSYEEGKEYLLEYKSSCTDDKRNGTAAWYDSYRLKLTPKSENSNCVFQVSVANLTSPDKKVTLEEAYVIRFYQFGNGLFRTDNSVEIDVPVWLPGGYKVKTDKYGNDEKYDVAIDDFTAILIKQGFIETQSGKFNGEEGGVFLKSSSISFKVASDINSAGMRPVISYSVKVDKNTDKLQNMENSYMYFLEQ